MGSTVSRSLRSRLMNLHLAEEPWSPPGCEGQSSLTLSGIRVKICNEDKLKALVTATMSDFLVIRKIMVISGRAGLFVAFPSRRIPDGSYMKICEVLGTERAWVDRQILEAYKLAVEGPGDEPMIPV